MNDTARQEAETETRTDDSGLERQALLEAMGQKLSRARQERGQSIDEPVRKLKLHKQHLEALESGCWDNMPDDVYVLGFLRQYSRYLNVDISDELERLKNDRYALTKPLTFPDPPVAPSRRWAWLAGGAFVLLFILFNVLSDTDTSTVQHDTILPDTPSNQTETVQPAAIPASTTESEPDEVSAEQQAGEHTEETEPAVTEPKLVTNLEQPVSAPQAEQTTTMHEFRFEAVGAPVWLQISLSDETGKGKGRLLKEVLLQPGSHASIRKKTTSLWITCGNAPALRIRVDDRVAVQAGSLGSGKKVLRDFHFQLPGR